jgi:hypothetical protein
VRVLLLKEDQVRGRRWRPQSYGILFIHGLSEHNGSLAYPELKVDAADPGQDLAARLHWKQTGFLVICADLCLRSRSAEVGFAVWEFRDLGSGVGIAGSTARVAASSTFIFDSAAPGANVT